QFADFAVQAPLDLDYALLGCKYLAFVFLQLCRREAFRVHQRLFALVVSRREMHIGLRNLDVVTEYLVIANLERRDSGAFPFALLHRRNRLPALLSDIA